MFRKLIESIISCVWTMKCCLLPWAFLKDFLALTHIRELYILTIHIYLHILHYFEILHYKKRPYCIWILTASLLITSWLQADYKLITCWLQANCRLIAVWLQDDYINLLKNQNYTKIHIYRVNCLNYHNNIVTTRTFRCTRGQKLYNYRIEKFGLKSWVSKQYL